MNSDKHFEEKIKNPERQQSEVDSVNTDTKIQARETAEYRLGVIAGMSHDLRSPLNSLLILSRDLSENKLQNLHPGQVESAAIIYKDGMDLLALINKVIDITKSGIDTATPPAIASVNAPAPPPASKEDMSARLKDMEALLDGKRVLLVDDDMRNIFAMSSMLKEYGMDVIKADSGKNAIEILGKEKNMDLVLMDIMMPEMDGYETIRRIRAISSFNSLPIIALTANAMKEDKQKCLDAGATDYMSKPVDVDRLLLLMHTLLGKS